MPRFNIEHENKYYVFSTICDGFVYECDTFEELQEWRKVEYGVKQFEDEKSFEELNANKMSYEEAERRELDV